VKPGNVLITGGIDAPHAYLTDFGLTKDTGSQSGLTATGHWLGTLDYVAPEQVEGKAVDARADVYALGCVLYELLTGTVPFRRDSDVAKLYAHAHEPPPVVSAAVPELPPGLDGVVQRALAKEPADRFPSAGDLGRAVQAAIEGHAIETPERSVAAGAAAPPGPPSRSATRIDPAPPPVTPPAQHQGWTPVTQPDRERGGRGGLALALVVAALVLAGAAVAVALIATGGGGDSGTATSGGNGDTGSSGSESGAGEEPSGGGGEEPGGGGTEEPGDGATTKVMRFSTPRDSGQPYRAAYCDTRAERLYCWTPNDGFTLELSDGPGERAGNAEEEANTGHAPDGYPVLAFGETRQIGDFTCTSRPGTEGLSCEGPSGNGWQMPRYEGCPRLFGPDSDPAADLCNRPG
jgi:hypothetical protein